jgi:hypothetical protein
VLPLYAAWKSWTEPSGSGGGSRLPALEGVLEDHLPLSLPGVIAGCFLVFIPAVGEFVIPDLLGGSDTLMIGKTLWVEFFSNRDWPVSSAVAVILLMILVIPIVLFQNQQQKGGEGRMRNGPTWFNMTSLVFGFSFLYLPIVLSGDLLVQRKPTGDRLGRVLHQVVCGAPEERSVAVMPPG